MKTYGIILCAIPLFFFQATFCYPIDKSYANEPELKDEIRYSNGTVIGKYSYKDFDGNPINVKYYADDSSYGVELNSIKVLESSTKEALHKPKPTNYRKPMEPLLDLASEIMNFNNPIVTKYKSDSNIDKNAGKVSHLTHDLATVTSTKSGNPDYDTLYQNEVKAPKQCEKNKVRVYLVKDKRKTRSALEEDASKYCEQF